MHADKAQFKGKFGQIAELFGPEASYDAVKSEWKKVSRLGDDLRRLRYGQLPEARATQSSISRRRQRPARVSIKPETHDIIDLDGNETLREPRLPSVQAKKVLVPNHAIRKHNLDTNDAAAQPEDSTASRSKRVRLDPELNPNLVRDGGFGPYDEVDYRALPRNPDDLFEQIRRALSETPINNPTSNLPEVTSSSVITGSSTVQPVATLQASRPTTVQDLSSGWREPSHCQVSITEHDRRYWENLQQPLPPTARMSEMQPRSDKTNAEAGASRITPNRYAGVYPENDRAPSVISISDSDEVDIRGGDADREAHLQTSTGSGKGKERMATPSTKSFNQGSPDLMMPRVSYINIDHGVCYLCSVQFDTVGELLDHERGKYHAHMHTDDVLVEKAQARLGKYGLSGRFGSEMGSHFLNTPAAGGLQCTQRQARTIIRGPDRALDLDEDVVDRPSLQEVVEVSPTRRSAYCTSGKSTGRPPDLIEI
jgi:hypothetical protein